MNVSRTSRSSVRAEVEQAILDYSQAFDLNIPDRNVKGMASTVLDTLADIFNSDEPTRGVS